MGFVVKAVKSVVKAVVSVVKGVFGVVGMLLGVSKPKGNANNAATAGRLSKKLEPEDFCKIVFGETAMACDLRFWEVHGSSNDLYSEVLAAAAHTVESFGALYVEDDLAISAGSTTGLSPYDGGTLTRSTNTGAPGASALAVGAGVYWTSASKFTGVAHYALKWKYDEKKLPSGIPSRYTQVGKGALVYDPRRDSTKGGSGSMRVDDQSTWSYATLDGNGQPIGRNNALQMLWYLIGWRVQNPSTGEWLLRAGRGVEPADINWPEWIAAANDAEAQGYYTDMILSTGDEHEHNESIISADGLLGELLDPGGLWTYKVTRDDTLDVAVVLTEDDIVEGDVSWVPETRLSEKFNEVAGTYIDPSSTSLYQSKAYPTVTDAVYTAADGYKKRTTHNFQCVQDVELAQKLARIKLNRARFTGEFEATFNYRALKTQVWGIVELTLDRYGFDSKLFRVISQSITDSGITMTLREEDPSVYSGGTVVIPPPPSAYPQKYDTRQQIVLTGLGIAAGTRQAADGTAQDGLVVSWSTPAGTVRRTEVEYQLATDTAWSPAMAADASVTSLFIGPLLPTASYNVRARHVSVHEVPGPWAQLGQSTDGTTKAPATRVYYDDGQDVESLQPATPGATANVGRGNYSAGTTYSPGDLVLWAVADGGDGNGYIRIGSGPTTGVDPSNATYWEKFVERGSTGPSGPAGPSGSDGSDGAPALTAYLTNEAVSLFAYADGTVTSYTPATGYFKVFEGSADVSANFTLSTLDNPQGLTVNYAGQSYTVTSGLDPAEDTGSLTIRATGSGAYAGQTYDKVFSLSKVKGGYEIVNSLPTTNLFNGRVVYLTTDGKLYRYNSPSWTAAVESGDITGTLTSAQIAAGAITVTKFASGIEPVTIVSGVPGSLLTQAVFNTADGKLYRWNGSSYVATVATTDLSGQVTDAQIAALSAAKVSGQLSDSQLAAISAAKVTGTLVDSQIAALSAGKVTGQLSDSQLAAISAAKVTGTLVDSQIASLGAGKITGQLTDSQLAALSAAKLTGQITSTQITDGAISTPKLAAGSVTTAVLAAGSVLTSNLAVIPESILPDPYFSDTAWWSDWLWNASGWFFQDAASGNGPSTIGVARGVTLMTSGTAERKHLWGRMTKFAAKGQVLRLRATAVNTSNDPVHVAVRFYGPLDAPGGGGLATAEVVFAANSGISTLDYQFAVPAGSAYYQTIIYNEGASPVNTNPTVGGIKLDFAATADLLVDGTISAAKLVVGTITSSYIAAGAITSTQLAAGSVVAGKIAASSITATELAAGSVTATQLAASSVIAGKIAAGAVTATELAAGSVVAGKIAASAVTATELAAGAVTATKLAAGSVLTSSLAVIPDSILPDPYFYDTAWWTENGFDSAGWYFEDAATGPNNARNLNVMRCASLATAASPGRKHMWGRMMKFSGEGQVVRLRAKGINNSNDTICVAVRFYGYSAVSGGAPLGTDLQVIFPANSGVTTQTAQMYVPAGTAQYQTIVYNNADAAVNSVPALSGVKLDFAATADLLVDGTISAAKLIVGTITGSYIAADTITGAQIAAGAISASELAAGAVTTDKLAVGTGANLLVNTGTSYNPNGFMEVAGIGDGVVYSTNGTAGKYILSPLFGSSFPGSDWTLTDGSTFAVYQPNATTGPTGYSDFVFIKPSDTAGNTTRNYEVVGNDYYEFSVYTGAHRCSVQSYIQWLDVNQSHISYTGPVVTNASEASGGKALNGYKRLVTRGQAPSNAAYARLYMRKFHTNSGTDSWMFMVKPMFARTVANASQDIPWSASGATLIDGGNIITRSITATQIVTGSITANELAAGSVTAAKMSVTSLSSITATIGTLRTATTGARMELSDNVLKVFDASNVKRVQLGNLDI